MVLEALKSDFRLPSGNVLPHRVVKSAMSENLSDSDGAPNAAHQKLYRAWAKRGAGLMITGNIMIDHQALAEPGNVVVEDERHLEALQRWAAVVEGTNTQLWAQINHPGGQALPQINKQIWGPSERTTREEKQVKALTDNQIKTLIERFANTAAVLEKAGFSGVQIHAAHGYLLSEFLSPLKNLREDEWRVDDDGESGLLFDVVKAVKERVGNAFAVGVKINGADYGDGGFERVGRVAEALERAGVDLLEISGGTYKQPAMMGAFTSSEPYFANELEYVKSKVSTMPVMVTGGFSRVETMCDFVEHNKTDLVGLGRPFVMNPNLAAEIMSGETRQISRDNPSNGWGPVLIKNRALRQTAWYQWQLQQLAQSKNTAPKVSMARTDFAYLKKLLGYKFGV